jgi:hypothetical protein
MQNIFRFTNEKCFSANHWLIPFNSPSKILRKYLKIVCLRGTNDPTKINFSDDCSHNLPGCSKKQAKKIYVNCVVRKTVKRN